MRISPVLAFLVILSVIACLAPPQAVLAANEPPPPLTPDNAGEQTGKPEKAALVIVSDGISAQELPVSAPKSPPDSMGNAVQAYYTPEGTLLDSHGNPVTQAADFAVNSLSAPLAMGCPAGVLPFWLGGSGSGCTSAYTSIQAAIDDAKVKSGWTVHVQQGIYNEPVNLKKVITLRGEAASSTTINGMVTLSNTSTLKGFNINGQVYSDYKTGVMQLSDLNVHAPGNNGIYINDLAGGIRVNHVISNGNLSGARLWVRGGSSTSVKVFNSTFDNSTGGEGLAIHTPGLVKIENVSVSNTQDGTGLIVEYGSNLTILNSQFSYNTTPQLEVEIGLGARLVYIGPYTGVLVVRNVQAVGNKSTGLLHYGHSALVIEDGIFNDNHCSGLLIDGSVSVVINRIDANRNGYFDCAFHPLAGMSIRSHGRTGVTISNSRFNNNQSDGVVATGSGAMKASFVQANENGTSGISFNNYSSYAYKPLTVTGTETNYNGYDGLSLYTWGLTTIAGVTASHNGSAGLEVNSCNDAPPGCYYSPGVVISSSMGTNEFHNNLGYGIQILTGGPIRVGSVSVRGNGVIGAKLEAYNLAGGTVTDSEFSDNLRDGLIFYSFGALTISRVTSADNGEDGITLDTAWTILPKEIVVTNTVVRNNGSSGLVGFALGKLVLNHVRAVGNTDYGVYLDNCILGDEKCWGSGAISISSSNGQNEFDGNGLGLRAQSRASISLSGFSASNNTGGSGMILVNPIGSSGVTVSSGKLNNNYSSGLVVSSNGSISLTGVMAHGNKLGRGASLYNSTAATSSGYVTIKSSSFNQNFDMGLVVSSKGHIYLNNVEANGNLSGGAWLDNCVQNLEGDCTGSGSVYLLSTLGTNSFSWNPGGAGLWIESKGDISISRTSAVGNGLLSDNSGMVLFVYGSRSITITCSATTGNGLHGINAHLGTGVLTLAGVLNANNDRYGEPPDSDLFRTGGTLVIKRSVCN